jgi:hypothetical protein
MSIRFAAVLALTAGACWAQQYEMGVAAGGTFVKSLNVTGDAGTATTGFKTGLAFSGYVGHNMYQHLSGEVRYDYLQSDLRLASGGTEATFSGQAHAVHYDLLFHTRKDSPVQLFAAAGGGIKYYRGTGREAAYQPLSQFAYLTKTQELKPLISVGGGVKFQLSHNVYLRVEARDYITPFPQNVITPAPGMKISGWVHDIVPMVGIGVRF